MPKNVQSVGTLQTLACVVSLGCAGTAREAREDLGPEVFTPARSRLLWLPVHLAVIALSTAAIALGLALVDAETTLARSGRRGTVVGADVTTGRDR